MKLILSSSDQTLIQNLIISAGESQTVECYIEQFMQSMNTLLETESYGCCLFKNSLTDKSIVIDNNPPAYTHAYFNGLNELDLLFQNLFEPNAVFTSYTRFVAENKGAITFFEESKKIKKHGDYWYRPLHFKNRIIGFYGFVYPERGKSIGTQRDSQIIEFMEPLLGTGIQQTLFKEKMQYQDAILNLIKHKPHKRYAILYLYPRGIIEIPPQADQELIREALLLDNLNPTAIHSHPLIRQLFRPPIHPVQTSHPPPIKIQRKNGLYTLRIQPNLAQQGYRFVTAIYIEEDQDLYPGDSYASQYTLTKREQEILDTLVQGMSNKQISNSLFISEATVKKHIYNIFEKTGCRSRTQLVLSLAAHS